MSKKRTGDKWDETLKEWKESGESQGVFCRRNNIPLSTFGYHLKKEKNKVKDSGFVKVPIKIGGHGTVNKQTVRIETGYCTISIEGQSIKETLPSVLRILREVNK
jgi:hypothetical protein